MTAPEGSGFRFTRHNRSPRSIAILCAVYAVLLALVLAFDAAWWLIGLLALGTLPALWDVLRNTDAGLSLEPAKLRWHSGARQGEIDLTEIDFFRFDTRWDFSVRVSIILTNGKRLRLPDEALPPHKQMEQALQQAGFRVDRHHFTVF
jgi:hypothetical protein